MPIHEPTTQRPTPEAVEAAWATIRQDIEHANAGSAWRWQDHAAYQLAKWQARETVAAIVAAVAEHAKDEGLENDTERLYSILDEEIDNAVSYTVPCQVYLLGSL